MLNIIKNKESIDKNNAPRESGNVLFLILIAVALFAALSYAVTSSSRSGSGNTNDETNLINSSTITQYPASIRTAIIRMQVSKNITTAELEFNAPADFANCETAGGVLGANCVFHPDGGSATFAPASANVMASGTQTDWVFNSDNQINLIGRTVGTTNTATAASADVIAFLVGVRKGICQRINEELRITGIPVETNTISVANTMVNVDGTTPPGIGASGTGQTIGGDIAALDGQSFGCFRNGAAGPYVYYHVLIEQ